MSAFLVAPEHIQQLVLFSHGRVGRDALTWMGYADEGDRDEKLASLLALANLRSMRHRYPNDPSMSAADDEAYIRACVPVVFHMCQLTPVQVLKAIGCLDYQSCEVPDWRDTLACRALEALKDAAISMLPGWNEAAWAIDATKLQPNSQISLKGLVRSVRKDLLRDQGAGRTSVEG